MKTILVSSLGGTPQVVTETLWALMNPHLLIDETHRDRDAVFPKKIHILTTAFMKKNEPDVK
ncbi:MAG: hypothetical protein KUG69_12520 [Marinosulfonomonas sp.]|nr:hypothetical protein [Marinosulfonomonas sp.]